MVDQSSVPLLGQSPADVVRRAHDAFAIGDIDAVMRLYADDITFHIPGTSPLSGEWRGRERVLAFFAKAAELSEGTLALSPDEVLADGERVVVLTRVRARRKGRSEVFTNVHVLRVVDGKMTELREYMGDERREDEFWGSPQ
jgi:ketosteroid isomerase-like protein